jgi:hypothetical protein
MQSLLNTLKSSTTAMPYGNGRMVAVAPAGNGGAVRIPAIKGAGIRHRKLTAKQRAARAAQELLGELAVHPSLAQVAQRWNVSLPYARAAAVCLTRAQRERIAAGANIPLPLRPIDDADLIALGPEKLLAAALKAEQQSAA